MPSSNPLADPPMSAMNEKWHNEDDWNRAYKRILPYKAPRGGIDYNGMPIKPSKKGKPVKNKIDVVPAKGNTTTAAKCVSCGKKPKSTDAVVRIRDINHADREPVIIHRRCMETALVEGAMDEDRLQERFDAYVDEVAEKRGIARG